MTWQRRGKAFHALGRLKTGEMNKTERAYGLHLEALKAAGKVLWYKFEGLKLRLADATFYTPDYAVIAEDGVLECHEVKGFWQDDARVKIKVAADLYPFRFKAVRAKPRKDGGGWAEENFSDATPSVPDVPATLPRRELEELPF